MKVHKFIVQAVNLPLKIWRVFIPSLPESIKDFNTIQRLWLVLSILNFIFWLLLSISLQLIQNFRGLELLYIVQFILYSFLLPAVIYHGVALTFKALSAFFGFLFEKDADKIKEKSKSIFTQIDSKVILRYLLIILVLVIIVVLLVGAFN